MTQGADLSALTIGPITGAATFFTLSAGHFPLAFPRPFGRALLVRWVGLGAGAALEEVVWRGIVLGGLAAAVGPWPALAASSVGFALAHWFSVRRRCAVHLVTGVAFGAACLAGGLVAAILGHAIYNLLVDWAVHAGLRGR